MSEKRNIELKKSKVQETSNEVYYKLPKEFKVRVTKSLDLLTSDAEGEFIGWGRELYQIPDIWQVTQGKGVAVAVLDTGVDTDHPDLINAIEDVKDFTDEGVEDLNGHGTHCAGIVGARLNGVGLVGVAPACKLLIGKVLGRNGGRADWVAKGIYWAVEQGADIISMSLGGEIMSPNIYQAIQYALFYGKVVVCAAGNSGLGDGNTINYPGKNGGVITVAAHDHNGNPSGFSSRGGELDVMAPGSDIWSTYLDGKYAKLSGTSMATPFVSGLAALIMSRHKEAGQPRIANCEELKNRLLTMAAHPNHHDNHSGYGALMPFMYFR